jgi:PncC family amidohydrolase
MLKPAEIEQMQAGQTIEERVIELLLKQSYHICCAESCTGGLLAGALVNVSGASDVLNESYVTYSNDAKHRLLGVPEEILSSCGAVSYETAAQMARGAANAGGCEVGVGVTGIAGPTGGTEQKPVGLVYIGVCVKRQVEVCECHFDGDRLAVRQASVQQALGQVAGRLLRTL